MIVSAHQTVSEDKRLDAAPLGVLCMLIGVSLFPLSDACLKFLLNTYSVEQTTFLRAFVRFLALFLTSFLYTSPWKFFITERPLLHGKRLVASIISTVCFMVACREGSLTLIYTLGYATPLFMVIVSGLFLKEKVTVERWMAVALGMVGIVIAVQPGLSGEAVSMKAASLVLVGTFFAAVNKMFMRQLAKTEESLTIALYPNIATILLFSPLLWLTWQSMPLTDWLLFLAVGIALGLSQLLVAFSLRCAQASLLAPIDYTTFLWVVAIDTLVWDTVPTVWTLVGGSIILISTLWLFIRSRACQKA